MIQEYTQYDGWETCGDWVLPIFIILPTHLYLERRQVKLTCTDCRVLCRRLQIFPPEGAGVAGGGGVEGDSS
jgi:hypothetical protein